MLVPNRHGSSNSYRYGFNGMEKDDELKGEGNSYDFGFRIYDPRIGRFLSIDPKSNTFVEYSPYCYAANNPIYYIDAFGMNPKPYPKSIQKGLNAKEQWAYTAAAKFDIKNNQESFRKMDALEGHSASTFNSYHFHRITNFYMDNAKKESLAQKKKVKTGGKTEDYKLCSPSLSYAINRLYGWTGDDQIYKTEVEGKNSIMSTMREKGLVGSEKTFTGIDEDGKKSNHSESDPVKMDSNIAEWAKSKTGENGVGAFMVSVSGGFHSLMLIVDRRGKSVTYRLLDQHGNSSTGSSSAFDRTVEHTGGEINDYMLSMIQSWYKRDRPGLFTGDTINANIKVEELKRD